MARKYQKKTESGKQILLVDDDMVYVQVMKRVLENEGHLITTAESGEQALEVLGTKCFDLLLIDYYMSGMTGEELITKIRETDKYVQIVLQTGYANEQPPRDLIKRMDIQGFYNKGEGPENFLLWVDVGLKAAGSIQQVMRHKYSLRTILNGSPELFRIQLMKTLLSRILEQLLNLVAANNTCHPISGHNSSGQRNANCLIATMDADGDLTIQEARGLSGDFYRIRELYNSTIFAAIREAVKTNEIKEFESSSIIPLCTGSLCLGIIIIEEDIGTLGNIEMIKVFAGQAAVAVYNVQLYQQATFDPLTRIFMRGVFILTAIRELRLACRKGCSLCLMLIDIDRMKHINDTLGHLAGDQALKYLGEALSFASRETDIRGRIGGDEFALLLLDSEKKDIAAVAARIYEYLSGKKAGKDEQNCAVNCSIGACCLDTKKIPVIDFQAVDKKLYFKYMYKKLMQTADEALYEIKKKGGNALNPDIRHVCWQDFENLKKEFEEIDLEDE
ncbi:MAG: diguanylate cyclase [Spirochaetales bacterium]|nr:diguanylate cyclase [Spirochaetales bacterium]